MNNGLKQTQTGKALAHMAFYAGWPNAFSAFPVAEGIFGKRPN